MPLTTHPALLLRVAVSDALKMAGEPGLAEAVGEVAGWIDLVMPVVVASYMAGERVERGDLVERGPDNLWYRGHWHEMGVPTPGSAIGLSTRDYRRGELMLIEWAFGHPPEVARQFDALGLTRPAPVDGPASPGDIMTRGEDGLYRRYPMPTARFDPSVPAGLGLLGGRAIDMSTGDDLGSNPPGESHEHPEHEQHEHRDADDAEDLPGRLGDGHLEPLQGHDHDGHDGADDDHGGGDLAGGVAGE